MNPRGIILAATVLLAICIASTAHAQNWTCAAPTGTWRLNQPDADYQSGKMPTWADCEAWRNGDPGPDYVWSYGPSVTTTSTSTTTTTTTEPAPANTTTSELAQTSTTTTTSAPEPPTTTVPPDTTTTTTTQPPTTTAAATTTTTYQAPKTTTSSSSTTTLAIASSTTDLASTTTSPDTTLPVFDSIPANINQNTVVTVHGVKPRRGYGPGTTPATPIVQTVTVLLTSPISPISLARRKTK